jgi:gamma-glutamyltranspeptidase/glutathione hydrolase
MLDHGMDVGEAIAAPRIAFLEPNTLIVEEGIPEAIRDQLAAMGHHLQVGTIGNANGLAIEYDEDGSPRFTGATDPRGSGLASGF